MTVFNIVLIAVFAACAVLSAIFCFERIWCLIGKRHLIASYLPDHIRLSSAYPIIMPIFMIMDIGAAIGWAFTAFASLAFIARLVLA